MSRSTSALVTAGSSGTDPVVIAGYPGRVVRDAPALRVATTAHVKAIAQTIVDLVVAVVVASVAIRPPGRPAGRSVRNLHPDTNDLVGPVDTLDVPGAGGVRR